MIDRCHGELSVVRQCELLDISRSSVYYNPVQASEYNLELMELIGKQVPADTLLPPTQDLHTCSCFRKQRVFFVQGWCCSGFVR